MLARRRETHWEDGNELAGGSDKTNKTIRNFEYKRLARTEKTNEKGEERRKKKNVKLAREEKE